MRRIVGEKGVVMVMACLLALSAGGCPRGLGPGVAAFFGGFLGALLGGGLGGTSITVERNCFENGQPIDCAQIPSGFAAGG